jgi:hypothetical protein
VVTQAIDIVRPAGEPWAVTMAQTDTTLRLDFTHGTDAPRSLTVAVDGDDDQHSQVFRSVCKFVSAYGPTGGRPSQR